MTRIDFYLLGDPDRQARDLAVCKLVHKVHALGHRVYIHTADDEESRRLDELLWTFTAGSFVPHAVCRDDAPDTLTPVLIGAGPFPESFPESFNDVLITTAPEVSDGFDRFERVAEVVGGADDDKARARDRYRHYRDRGYTLHTHNL